MPLMNLGVVANWSLLASTAKIKWAIFMWTKRIKTYQIKKKNALASASLCLIPSIENFEDLLVSLLARGLRACEPSGNAL